MADKDKKDQLVTPASPIRSPEGNKPESPRTVEPLDFDDDDTATPTKMTLKPDEAPNPPPKDEAPPPKPPRPLSPQEQAETTLKEAFPSIDAQVIKAVLAASGGQVEPAFNALLGMTDPDAAREPEPPARPPRPIRDTSTQQSQLEADELYARQLHEHFANTEREHTRRETPGGGPGYNEHLQGSRTGRPGATYPENPPQWRSFIDDDLPEIRDSIAKGFKDTQNTVNRWISNFKKSIDGEEEDDAAAYEQRVSPQSAGRQPAFPRRSNDGARRSADLARYDADPQVIDDDFSKLDLKDNEHPPRTSSRPLANPNLFKSSSESGRAKSPGSGRKVSFQDGPPEEISDMYSSTTPSTTVETKPAATVKTSKWQPLSKVDPSPVQEHDPFSLGDSDDDAKDAKPITLKDDDDNAEERLKKAMSEAASDSIGAESKADAKK